MKKKTYIIALFTLILVIIIGFIVYQTAKNNVNDTTTNQNQTTSSKETATSDSKQSDKNEVNIVKAKDLFEAYKNDPSKKEATSDGEHINVNGVITYIGQDSHGTPSINLSDTANGEGYVLCVFGSFEELDAFSLGQEVTISANFHIMGSDGMVVLKQSKVI
ncbi:hypothetical protein IBB56_11080 [Listeria welshimeri]|uniref:tRNA_anti-like n=1 Tax=Listeria welshimeri TaxID=1643 RepID=A0A7X0W7L6_LISWE|nr:hypothetical protein [Listeria welshimeri]EAC8476549.1 hypothetical protein [Listeria monocytogenes]MBC1323444.1 hypothetical protein [Listeria welshimeri]MBC1478826.1 hypothetical protein [Listeria welshimeri]MBC1982107.1 hypothetical protein [Listeria welshimeri]MBC2007817.1 hypothetical protein [Listeria welshimeri]